MILVSACLAGFAVRYDGRSARNDLAAWLVARGQAIAACPEIMAGFPVPRPPAEITGTFRTVCDCTGRDVTARYQRAAEMALKVAVENNVAVAFLKDKSPACGVTQIYDGTFSGRKIPGRGVAAEMLARNGVVVFPDTDLTFERVRPYVDAELLTELEKWVGENAAL